MSLLSTGDHHETVIRILALRSVPVKRGGRSCEEIADMIGSTRTTIDKIYHRALSKVRAVAVAELGYPQLGGVRRPVRRKPK